MKKVLSLALAIVLLLSCFTVAFATVDDAALKIEIVPTETSYKNGDIVTFNFNIESDPNLCGKMGAITEMFIGFNGDAFEYIEDLSSMPAFSGQGTVVTTGFPIDNNQDPSNSFVMDVNPDGDSTAGYAGLSAAEKAKGWNKVLRVNMTPIIDPSTNDSLCDDDYSANVTCFQFKLKVKDAAAAGNYAVGVARSETATIAEEMGAIFDIPGDAMEMFGTSQVFQCVDGTVVIGSATAAPVLSTAGRQVKMDVVDNAVVAHTEQLRVVSSISNDDWNNYFANTTDEAATTDKLVEVGIVATQGAFDMEAAKTAAQQGKGVHGDYTVATTTYIQNTGSDYRFGARIEYQTNVFDTTYVAFAKYLNAEGAEAYVFYDASYALAFATDYSTITASYIAFLNGQA